MKAVSVRTFMRSEGMYLISFKVNQTNRGHGHLVVRSSIQSVEEGKLCDSIVRLCAQASRCIRKMDYSTGLSVFEFEEAERR